MLFGPYVDSGGTPVTGADLQRLSKDAYDFVIGVFRDRVPAALRDGFYTMENEMNLAIATRDSLIAQAEQRGGLRAWMEAAEKAYHVIIDRPGDENFAVATYALQEAAAALLRQGSGTMREETDLQAFEASVQGVAREYYSAVSVLYDAPEAHS
jgi:hypothetical protein